jgi:Ca2+/Na+ antiporter
MKDKEKEKSVATGIFFGSMLFMVGIPLVLTIAPLIYLIATQKSEMLASPGFLVAVGVPLVVLLYAVINMTRLYVRKMKSSD